MSLNQFSDHQIAEFQEAFSLFDKDGDGYLSLAEVGTIIRALGAVVSDRELISMEARFQHKHGMLDFADFLSMMATFLTSSSSSQDLLAAFQVLDKDGTGFISTSDLRHLITSLGEPLSQEDVEEMLREADPQGTGMINYRDFVRLITS